MKIYDYEGKKNLCGRRLREARIKQRISQSDLAARLQVAGIRIERDSISRMETGARFIADFELLALADILKVPVVWLLGIGSNTNETPEKKRDKDGL
ncbi:MAG: helix-turn-helix domain-containing protein [Gracilibacteraceae bacterium]|jgi:transcriptional regulator with XRE-family HTH domain|nr:helix-turn-helix domain-containing protein [Gracilibacteraceae bacterium]